MMAEVYHYCRHVDSGMDTLIARTDCPDRPIIVERLTVGLNHEQQRQELLVTDIKRNFSHNPLRPAYRANLLAEPLRDPDPVRHIDFEGGIREFGAAADDIALDNERPRHRVYPQPFARP